MIRSFRFTSITPLFALALSAWAVSAVSSDSMADTQLRDVIDQEIIAGWKANKLTPAPPASDAVFLRRIYLDLVGTIPTHDEAKAFLDDKSADKRSKLIDKLLEDTRYALHQGDIWDMVLFGRNPPGFDARTRQGFQQWIAEQFAKNTRWDDVVRAMLLAEGNTAEDGAPMFLVQYRRDPEAAVQAITQKFLGVQLQCARCHDHPYEDWTQLDFYGMAAFLARIDVVDLGKKGNEKKLVVGEKPTGDINFTGPAAEQTPGKKGMPVKPKFLHGKSLDEPAVAKDVKEVKFQNGKEPPKPKFSRKDQLAEWVVAQNNPYFARALSNRVWSQFMGRGITHPVDDMSASNKPTHPQLLSEIQKQLVAKKFDVKWLIREIVNSKTYQLGEAGNFIEAAPQWYQRARVRPLSAEELSDAWRVANNYVATDSKCKEQFEKGERFYPLTSGYVVQFLGEPANGQGNFQGGLHEHLFLNNGGISKVLTTGKGGLVDSLVNSEEDWPKRIDRLFLSVLSRYPNDAERKKFVEYMNVEGRKDTPVREAIWALMTCSEFRFNH